MAMSGDCSSIEVRTAERLKSNPYSAWVYPISLATWRTMAGILTVDLVVISPETNASPVVTRVSQATRAVGSPSITASKTESEIASAILSGWPSVIDSEVKTKSEFKQKLLTTKVEQTDLPSTQLGYPC